MKRLILALALGCSTIFAAQAQGALNRGNGAEPESLDPAFAGGAAEINILGDMMVGLTTRDAAAKPVPGIAERWDVSPNGLTWTFHLRAVRWSDGTPVAADDFIFAWRRLLDPRTAARTANMLWPVKNARAVSNGTLPGTALGVTAQGPHTLTVTLEHPTSYLPELLAHPAALPLPPAARKDGWTRPGSYVSDGPYLLKSWIPGDRVTLAKNPRFYDAGKVRIETVNYWPTPDTQAALRRLRAGELDMQTPLPSAQLDWMRTNMPGALHIVPSLALAYVAFNLRDPALKDGRVRRALNLVYDRDAVARKVMKLGETPAYSYVPPMVANYRGGPRFDFATQPYPMRLAAARKLMQEAGYGPFNRLRLDYAVSANPDSRRLAAVFQAMARQIYVDVQIRVADYQITLRNMRQGQFQLAYATWLADFDDAASFLDLLRTSNPNNYAGYRNPKFDAAMAAAEREADPQARARLMQGAEKMALADNAWLAIRVLNQSEAVGPRVGGYVPNARLYSRSRWLWIK